MENVISNEIMENNEQMMNDVSVEEETLTEETHEQNIKKVDLENNQNVEEVSNMFDLNNLCTTNNLLLLCGLIVLIYLFFKKEIEELFNNLTQSDFLKEPNKLSNVN